MKSVRKGVLRIGTSNISLPGNKQSFPPEFQLKSRLNYYGSLFNTLEVNSSFYKIPKPSTCERWAQDVPQNFQFTLKLFKGITHVPDLKYDPDQLKLFLQAAKGFGAKAGCILIQFPGKINFDYYPQVENLLHSLHELEQENSWRISVEFRSARWYVGETFELLNELGTSLVLHDIPKGKNLLVNEAAKFVYLRFHGPAGDYRGSYDENILYEHSSKIKEWLNAGKDVYVYFNNTIGSAFQNAMLLKEMNKY